MRLLLVLTGGTISTTVENGIRGIRGNSPLLVIENYRKACKEKGSFCEDVIFDVIEPVRMLSECSQPAYLEIMYYAILEKLGIAKNYHDLRKKTAVVPSKQTLPYDGILLTHGSDTLSYSAAFFSEVFSWLCIPLVLTASDYPLSDSRSNGMRNFMDAVDFLKQAEDGVFVIWKNKKAGGNVFLASELLEADNYQNCFSSYTGKPYGEIVDGVFVAWRKEHRKKKSICLPDIHMEWDVLFLRPYPGLRYDVFSLEQSRVRAVVHYLYHSATACTEQSEKNIYNILTFAKYCKELGIDFYAAGFQEQEEELYETNDALLKSGLCIPLYGLSPEKAYMKILVKYNQSFQA